MSKSGVFFKNALIVLILAASFLFIYRFANGSLESPGEKNAGSQSEVAGSGENDVSVKLTPLGEFLCSVPRSGGNTVTGTFDAETMRLALTDITSLGLTNEFSLSDKTVTVPERIPHEVFGTYTTFMKETEAPRIQLELYDGSFIVDRGDKLEFYSKDGNLISDSFVLSPFYRRDKNGDALYTDGTKFYFLSDNEFVESDYVPDSDTRVTDYENTADFASDTSGNYFKSDAETGLYAVFNSAGEKLTDYNYVKIYGYSEGLAAAVLTDGSISYLDTDGKVVFEGLISYRSMSDRYVHRIYCAPDTMGPESIGFIYFDNGLVMTRQKIADYVYLDNIISDSQTVLKTDGKKLGLPEDYLPVSSADGVVVAEKEGYYGAFSKDEKWVLHPKYEDIAPYLEGLSVVKYDGKYGVYDTVGNEILPLLFDYISPVSGGKIVTYSEEFGFIVFEKELIKA